MHQMKPAKKLAPPEIPEVLRGFCVGQDLLSAKGRRVSRELRELLWSKRPHCGRPCIPGRPDSSYEFCDRVTAWHIQRGHHVILARCDVGAEDLAT
jgi:hypothetical protein